MPNLCASAARQANHIWTLSELSFTRDHIDKKNYSRQNQNNGVNKKKVLNINYSKPEQKKHQKYPHKPRMDTSVRPKVKVSEDSKVKLKALVSTTFWHHHFILPVSLKTIKLGAYVNIIG